MLTAILYTGNSRRVITFFIVNYFIFFSGKNLGNGSQIKMSSPKLVELIDKGEYSLSRVPLHNFLLFLIENEKNIVMNELYITSWSKPS